MKAYVLKAVPEVQAEPQTYTAFYAEMGIVPGPADRGEDGYAVQYPELNHKIWMPRDTFEELWVLKNASDRVTP